MKSEADIIYNHIVRSRTDEVIPVKVAYGDNFVNIISQYACKTEKNIFSEILKTEEVAKTLCPYFMFEVKKWSKKIGLHINLWSEKEHERFSNYFMKKYEGLVK